MDSDAQATFLASGTYNFILPIPKQVFNPDDPVSPKTFGQRLRRARMDAGIQIKELAALLGVSEGSVINWEIRGMRPYRKDVRVKLKQYMVDMKD